MAGDDRDALRLRPARRSDEPTIWRATMETVWRDVPEDERVGLDRAAFETHFREYAADFVEGGRGGGVGAGGAAGGGSGSGRGGGPPGGGGSSRGPRRGGSSGT